MVGQVLRFAGIGALSTIAYLFLYAALRAPVGSQSANFVALLLTALGNTAANRRLTFGVRGREGSVKHQGQGLVVFGVGLALTSGSLALLHAVAEPPVGIELGVLVIANLIATAVRFVLLRRWVFGRAV